MRSPAMLFFAMGLMVGSAEAQDPSRKPASRPPVAPQRTLPVFSFMGDTTEQATSRTEINGSQCTTKASELECTDYGDPTLGGARLEWLMMSYNNGRLYRVMGSMYDHQYAKLMIAFSEKYGNPSIHSEKWQAKSGATFDNSVAEWAFKGGTLKLESMGSEIGKSSLLFRSSDNAPAPEKPKIDF